MKFSPMNTLQDTTWVLVTRDGQQIVGGERKNKGLRPVESRERIMFYKTKGSAKATATQQYKHQWVRPAKVRVTIEELVQNELEE